jgi:hypothetical protein
VLWELGQVNQGIACLESYKAQDSTHALAKKVDEIKERCQTEYGLAHDHADLKKIERFMKWMRDSGATFGNIRMKYYSPDFRGVHACRAIPDNSVFLSVPLKMIITPQSGRDTALGRKVLQSGVKVHWDYLVYITIYLLIEMHNPASTWEPYMALYPRMTNSFPMFYSDYEKSLLQGTPMLEHIATELSQVCEEYDRIVAAVPEFKVFTKDEYIRNKTLVISRIFYVKMNGTTERIMVPLAGTSDRPRPG